METTTYVYILAGLIALVVFILLYVFLVPQKGRGFESLKERNAEATGGVKFITKMSSSMYAALPEMSKGTTKKTRNDTQLKDLLVRSGNPWKLTPEEFRFTRNATAILGALVGGVIYIAMWAFGVWIPWYAAILVVGAIGYFVPDITYKEKANERDLDFKKNLPEALDLIIISVNAGNTFTPALRQTVPHLNDSLLKDELTSVLRDVDSGKSMSEALDNFADRAPSTGIVTFVRSLQEAIELETSLEETLRSRSDESRAELFSLIRERAAALPVKMSSVLVIPLSFALLIILLAPFAVSFVNGALG